MKKLLTMLGDFGLGMLWGAAIVLVIYLLAGCSDGGPQPGHAALAITFDVSQPLPPGGCYSAEFVATVQAPGTDTAHVLLKWLDPGTNAGSDELVPRAFRVDPGMRGEEKFLVSTWRNTALLLEATLSSGVVDSLRYTVMGPADFQAWIDLYPACAWLGNL